jgi:hypothetical protein
MAHDRPGRQDRPCYLLPCYSTLLLHSATAPRYPPSAVHALAVLGSVSLPRTPPHPLAHGHITNLRETGLEPAKERGALSIRPNELLFTSDMQKTYISIYLSLAPARISALAIVKRHSPVRQMPDSERTSILCFRLSVFLLAGCLLLHRNPHARGVLRSTRGQNRMLRSAACTSRKGKTWRPHPTPCMP